MFVSCSICFPLHDLILFRSHETSPDLSAPASFALHYFTSSCPDVINFTWPHRSCPACFPLLHLILFRRHTSSPDLNGPQMMSILQPNPAACKSFFATFTALTPATLPPFNHTFHFTSSTPLPPGSRRAVRSATAQSTRARPTQQGQKLTNTQGVEQKN